MRKDGFRLAASEQVKAEVEEKAINGCIISMLALVAMFTIFPFIQGFLMMSYWAWFAIPLANILAGVTLNPMTILQGWGLCLLFNVFKMPTQIKNKENDSSSPYWAHLVVFPFVAIFMWIFGFFAQMIIF